MPKRDRTWPQWKWSWTWVKMGECKWGKNIPFEQWQETWGCWGQRGLWHRWANLLNEEKYLCSDTNQDEEKTKS